MTKRLKEKSNNPVVEDNAMALIINMLVGSILILKKCNNYLIAHKSKRLRPARCFCYLGWGEGGAKHEDWRLMRVFGSLLATTVAFLSFSPNLNPNLNPNPNPTVPLTPVLNP